MSKDKRKRFKSFRDTEKLFPRYLNSIYEENKHMIDNYNLHLNRFITGQLKKNELKIKIDILKHNINFNLVKNYIENYNHLIKALHDKTYIIKEINFKPDYKLIIGLGNPSVYEVSMTLHHIYGIPYIPAQAIKGVLRNYVINRYFSLNKAEKLEIANAILNKNLSNIEELEQESKEVKQKVYKKIAENKEKKALENKLFKFIFGKEDNKGNVIFFDAFPIGKVNIEVDIMNNHFPDYYEEKAPPADYQNPRPIKFLAVKDTKFKFFIGLKKNIKLDNLEKFDDNERIINKEHLLEYTTNLLKEAFELNGIGAKTSIGYGYGVIEV